MSDIAEVTAHVLKTDPEPFEDVLKGRKTFEIRYDDRGYEVGNVLHLRETRFTGDEMRRDPDRYPLEYTGRDCWVGIIHILRGGYGLMGGWIIASITAPFDNPNQLLGEEKPRPKSETACQYCRWWGLKDHAVKDLNEARGVCRVNPPVLLTDDSDHEPWPVTYGNEFCGKFEKKPFDIYKKV